MSRNCSTMSKKSSQTRKDTAMKAWIKVYNDKRYKVLEFDNGHRVEIPRNADGTVKWLTEPVKEKLEVQ